MSELIQEQREPQPNASKPIWELVVEDMHARDHEGRRKYGTPLQANNGRDPLVDAYQEALDLCVYLRQTIEERDNQGGDDVDVGKSMILVLGTLEELVDLGLVGRSGNYELLTRTGKEEYRKIKESGFAVSEETLGKVCLFFTNRDLHNPRV